MVAIAPMLCRLSDGDESVDVHLRRGDIRRTGLKFTTLHAEEKEQLTEPIPPLVLELRWPNSLLSKSEDCCSIAPGDNCTVAGGGERKKGSGQR